MTAEIRQLIASISGIEIIPEMEDAWTWSPAPRFKFVLALSGSGDTVFQINSIAPFDTGLAHEVLLFARENRLQDARDGRPMAVVEGFDSEGSRFDSVAVAEPAVHGYYVGRNERLNELVLAVFPAYRCEFSGTETLDEARYRFKSMLRPTLMNRSAVPFLKIRYANTKTGAGSVGESRGFTTADVLLRELVLLEGAAASFVECENYLGAVCTVEWDGQWAFSGDHAWRTSRRDDLSAWVNGFLGHRLFE